MKMDDFARFSLIFIIPRRGMMVGKCLWGIGTMLVGEMFVCGGGQMIGGKCWWGVDNTFVVDVSSHSRLFTGNVFKITHESLRVVYPVALNLGSVRAGAAHIALPRTHLRCNFLLESAKISKHPSRLPTSIPSSPPGVFPFDFSPGSCIICICPRTWGCCWVVLCWVRACALGIQLNDSGRNLDRSREVGSDLMTKNW